MNLFWLGRVADQLGYLHVAVALGVGQRRAAPAVESKTCTLYSAASLRQNSMPRTELPCLSSRGDHTQMVGHVLARPDQRAGHDRVSFLSRWMSCAYW
jgi:hypothetical protein